MDVTNEIRPFKTISWGSIIGGVVTVLAVSMLLSTLSTSMGFAIVDPNAENPTHGAGMAFGLWTAVSIVISLLAGAFVAGRLAGNDGMIHGFLVWATSLIVAAILGAMLVGSAVSTAGNMLGSIASASGSVISGAGDMLGKGASGLGEMGKSAFDQFTINTDVQSDKVQDDVAAALKKSNIPTLQPDYLKQQMVEAKGDITQAVKQLATAPNNSDAVIQGLTDKLKARADAISKGIDRDDLKKVLTENTSMTPQEVDKTIDNMIQARDKAAQEVDKRLSQAQDQINQAKQQYAEFKQEAADKAAQAASMMAKAALWSFFALLIGAVVSVLGGLWGVKTHLKYSAHA
ncbi:CAP-Gly protein [Lonsdalea populi]|uniref:CAP-Gly protein n=3 Tax=Lonsdalea TaxID=1082702 RepID=A0ACD1JAD9_9GAMM|nr:MULTISPECIES: CAP-Gly protein [Lonsdalea]OSM96865.1 CAP-Gly protein [Lonsdalea populi]OSN02386.1 CAP-Gly protein [Lonsdalea populi]QPQ25873.1 CAP-Gly protein [Lonsdalea populi]RAT11853.1 CAP-Gly protein [Lonsdalea quercina]RAT18601.1 CAP-Gly protein [Lonsdalea quercina]